MSELSFNDTVDESGSESFDFIWEEWEEYKGDVPLWQHIFCGSVAGVMEHVFMYPLDTIKTYFQTNTILKCKKKPPKCKINICNNNLNESNVHKNLPIDKRNYSSCFKYGGCINKACNNEKYCNIKSNSCSYISKQNFSFISALDMLKRKEKKLNKFHFDTSILYEKQINNAFSKKLNTNNCFNIKIKKCLSSNECGISRIKQLLSLKRNGHRFCDLHQGKFDNNLLYNSKNKRIYRLKRNVTNLKDNTNMLAIHKMNKLSKFVANKKHDIHMRLGNSKKESLFFSVHSNNKTGCCSKKIRLKAILKKDKTSYKWKTEHHKHLFHNTNMQNYGHKRLKFLRTNMHVKQNNGVMLAKDRFLLYKHLGKGTKINGKKCLNYIQNKNNFTWIYNFKSTCLHMINTRFSNSGIIANNNSDKSYKNLFKFGFQNFMYNKDKNSGGILYRKLRLLKNTNYYHILNNTLKKSSTYPNYYSNLLYALKRENNANFFVCMLHNMKNLCLTHFTFKNRPLHNKGTMRKNNLFLFLRNSRSVLLNSMCYLTRNKYITNLYDRNIHSSCKYSFYKNNNTINIINKYSNNFKKTIFLKNIFIHKNEKSYIKMMPRYNCNSIRTNFINLYKGVNVVMIGCIPAHALYFSTFEYSKKYFSNISLNNSAIKIINSTDSTNHDAFNYKLNNLNYFSIIISGFLATLAHDLIITPVDTLKQRIQLGINKNGLDSIKMLKENGLRSLYLSLPITLLMNIPYHVIMICTNEQMKKIYFEYMCGFTSIHKNSSENAYNTFDGGNIIKKEANSAEKDAQLPITINYIKEGYDKMKDAANKNTDKGINSKKEEINMDKLVKLYSSKDIYSTNNYNKNAIHKFQHENELEKEKKDEKAFFNEDHNSNVLLKSSIEMYESNCKDNTGNVLNKFRNSLNFENTKNIDLKNISMYNYKNEYFNKHFNHITSYFVCAGIGGGIAAILTNPLDIIKTRIQTECFNTKGFHFFKIVSNLYYKEGLRSFFKGSLARMSLCIPASAISWGSYEAMKHFFKINFNSM